MSLDADAIIERRRLRKRVMLWRVAAFAALAVAVIGIAIAVFGRTAVSGGSHIARVTISGLITGDRATLRLIEQVSKNASVAGVIVNVNSPGGTVPGSEAVHEALRRLAAEKPTVAVVGNTAASGGYIAALGADHVIARRTAIVGSIGVLFQFPNVTRLLDRVGVTMEVVRSAPLKAAPSGVEPTSPEAREAVNQLVMESYDWFKGLVKERRKLDDAELQKVADGRVFSGAQALGLKLVDGLGSEREAQAWLETSRNVAKGLTIREWRRANNAEGFGLGVTLASGARFFGFDRAGDGLEQMQRITDMASLDGLLAVWQPSGEK
jgi:protease IV